MSHGQVAKRVREDKELHPERYCAVAGCLWKTAMVSPDGKGYILNSDPCQKHDAQRRLGSCAVHEGLHHRREGCTGFQPATNAAIAEDTFARF